MPALSIFDIFKIGVGPSSSHTLGPWKAGQLFAQELAPLRPTRIQVQLYGSLSKTGKGHATDLAVQLGLMGFDFATIDTQQIPDYISKIAGDKSIDINGRTISFDPEIDIKFENHFNNAHPNTLTFTAYDGPQVICERLYTSVGGGFVEGPHLTEAEDQEVKLPFPIENGNDIIQYCDARNANISDIVFANEECFAEKEKIIHKVDLLLETILECVYQGCMKDGVLPGGLNVNRRAKGLCFELTENAKYSNRDEWMYAISQASVDFNTVNKWVSCFALAVNEENASLSRVVTSPTNGAAGVIPAVLLYYYFFCDYGGKDMVRRFLFTAGEVGCLFKKGATISAAVGGCQAEIGVSSAMAAAGLTEVLGGSPSQVLMAAEIAMEHHLGLTCDPVGGLVQVPCIERNAMGAMKAITASNLALSGNPETAIVKLDTVIKTMWDTAQDMNTKYKETSEGGLAFNLPVIMANC